jgi:hypothetical protein
MSAPTCKTCQWWTARTGECDGIGIRYTGSAKKPSHGSAVIDVEVSDDHGLDCRVLTGPDFACALHSAAQPK